MARKIGTSDGDLLEHVMNLGARGPPTCGTCLLDTLGGLLGLTRACPASLSRLGLTPSQVAAVLAVVEIARRLARRAIPDRDREFPSPDLLARYVALQYGGSGQEVMGAFFLTARGDVLGEEWLFRGTLHRCSVEPAPILKAAELHGAAGILLWPPIRPVTRGHRVRTSRSRAGWPVPAR